MEETKMQTLGQTAPARSNERNARWKTTDKKESNAGDAPVLRASPDIYSFTDKDGTTILHVERDKMYSVIGVGSLIWAEIVERPDGIRSVDLVGALVKKFQEIPRPQIEADVDRIVKNFRMNGFLQTGEPSRRGLGQRLRNQIETVFVSLAQRTTRLLLRLKLSTLAAFLGLFAINLILKLVSFSAFYHTVKRWPVRAPFSEVDPTPQLCEAIDRATVLYPKQAMCLQRSAVAACLLRSSGRPAQMVIGCRKIPFKSHAWAEVCGQVVNDKPKVQEFYRVLDRC
jgi:hypothetical protein